MPENAPPDPEKNRRSRSFGSFLLVLLVLLVVLALLGNDRLTDNALSQDQYEWYLNRGDVVQQEFKGTDQGTNLIEGVYRSAGQKTKFKVHYSSLDDGREARFRELKGIRDYRDIRQGQLLSGIEKGDLVPSSARFLTAYEKPGLEEGALPEGEMVADLDTSSVRREQKLLVSAVAKSAGTRLEPRLDDVLPAEAGEYHFDVRLDRVDDLAALLTTLEASGATVERHVYDITKSSKEGGTYWKDNTSPFGTILLYLGPWILLFVVFLIFMRQMRSQGGAGGRHVLRSLPRPALLQGEPHERDLRRRRGGR